MGELSIDVARQIVEDFIKRRKKAEKVDVSNVMQKSDCWIVIGTCPTDLEGHLWAEKFEIVLDQKGKIKSAEFTLL